MMAYFGVTGRSMSLLTALAELGFGGVDPEATGRPSYHPSGTAEALHLRLPTGFSRRLEREAGRNVEVMWLTGRRLLPDHKKTAGFRKDNGPAIRMYRLLGQIHACAQ
jgi:transposase